MIPSLTPIGQAGQPKAADIVARPFDFNATELTLDAVTDAGKALFASMFGSGAVSVNMPKSRGLDFERFAEQKGLTFGTARL